MNSTLGSVVPLAMFYLSLDGKMKFISDFVSFQFSLKVASVNEGEIHMERMDK